MTSLKLGLFILKSNDFLLKYVFFNVSMFYIVLATSLLSLVLEIFSAIAVIDTIDHGIDHGLGQHKNSPTLKSKLNKVVFRLNHNNDRGIIYYGYITKIKR